MNETDKVWNELIKWYLFSCEAKRPWSKQNNNDGFFCWLSDKTIAFFSSWTFAIWDGDAADAFIVVFLFYSYSLSLAFLTLKERKKRLWCALFLKRATMAFAYLEMALINRWTIVGYQQAEKVCEKVKYLRALKEKKSWIDGRVFLLFFLSMESQKKMAMMTRENKMAGKRQGDEQE